MQFQLLNNEELRRFWKYQHLLKWRFGGVSEAFLVLIELKINWVGRSYINIKKHMDHYSGQIIRLENLSATR